MRIPLITACYCFVMLLASSFYNSAIMDPIEILWALCYVLVGPALLVTSVIILVRGVVRRSAHPAKIAATVFSIIVVIVWTFGFWRIGELLRPLSFRLVSRENERLAESFMEQHPPDRSVQISGFRYPYFPLGSTRVSHHNGSVFIMVPSGPGPKDSLIYVSPGAAPSEGLQIITNRWYYDHATPN